MAKYAKKSKTSPIIWITPMLLLAIAIVISLGFLYKEVSYEPEPEIPLRPYLTVEAGNTLPDAIAFLYEEAEYEIAYTSDLSGINTLVPGQYPVTLLCGKQVHEAYISVVDTTPPTGKTQDLTVYQTEMPAASDFVVESEDLTDVTVSFLTEPDKNKTEPQNVTIVLTDTSGNETKLTASLTVIIDAEAPVIEGVKDFVVFTGNTIAYRNGVTVSDNIDIGVVLNVDSSAVDLSTAGEYEVVYSATDFFGNTSTVTAKVTVYQNQESYVDIEVIYEEADKLLAKIIKDGMTDREKVIKGLICHVHGDPHTRCHKCPYWGTGPHGLSQCNQLFADALAILNALLKAQEPRVMTLEEVLGLKFDDVVYLQV